MWDKLKISFPVGGPLLGTIGMNPQEKSASIEHAMEHPAISENLPLLSN